METEEASLIGLSGKTALITGSANGIGLAIARAFIAVGCAVELVDCNPDVIAAAQALDKENKGIARAHIADVRDGASLERIRDDLVKSGRCLDVVVPNAGINVRRPFIDLAREQVDAIIETNLTGVITTLQVFAPLFMDCKDASVVVISSAVAEHGMVLRTVYSATKAGTSGLVRSVALEWGRHGVRVNAVAPGIIRTPLTQAYMQQFPEREAAARTQVPLGRVGVPEEVADVVVMLAGRQARFMSGQTVFVDGGLTAGSSWW